MSSSPDNDKEQVRMALDALNSAVREMTPVGTKIIPASPNRFNLLARPHRQACRICNYPGHQSENIQKSNGCHIAIMSTVGFWENIVVHIAVLYSDHKQFHAAITENNPTYNMRLDNSPLVGKTFVEIFVNRLTCNYLKFQSHFSGIRPKAMVILQEHDLERYDTVTKKLNDFLLKGQTCK